MSSKAALAEDPWEDAPVADAPDWARPLIERQLAVLSDLTEAALAVTLSLQRKITAAHSDDVPGEVESLTLAFTRAARAVRQTIALQSKLIEDRQQWARGEAADRPSPGASRRPARDAARETAEHDCDDEPLDRLAPETRERLDDDEDRLDEVLARPVSETVALISRELGLAPDWPKQAEAAWARAQIRSGRRTPSVTARRIAYPPPRAGEGDREAVVGALSP